MRVFSVSLTFVFGLIGLLGSSPASAQPDISGSAIVEEPNGAPGFCDQPCYRVEKNVEVYLDGNPSAPGVCAVGENTFIYRLTHIGGNPLLPPNPPIILPLNKFEVEVPNAATNVSSAGFIPGPGVDPTATTINTVANVVTWDYLTGIFDGDTTDDMFICSALPPGGTTDTMVSIGAAGALDAPSGCVGPIEAACNLDLDKTCCVPQPALPDNDHCEGKLVRIKFKYTDHKASHSNNHQGGKFKCSGRYAPGTPASLEVLDDPDVTVSKSSGIQVGDEVEFSHSGGYFGKHLKLKTHGSHWWKKQYMKIETDCDHALKCGDEFGAWKVKEIESTLGGVVDCDNPPPTPEPTCDAPGDDPGTPCDAKLVDMLLEYNGQDCQDPLANPQNGEASCVGDATGATDVGVIYAGKFPWRQQTAPASNINDGDIVRVTATFNGGLFPNQKFLIVDESGVLQEIDFHVSCSQPLALGDEFGSFKLVGWTTKSGTTVALGDGTDGTFDACEVPLAPPGPHCTSDLQGLTLVYIGDLLGEGCSVSNNQYGYGTCSGVADPGDPVSVDVTNSGLIADPDTDIQFGETVNITNSGGGDIGSFVNLDVTGAGGSQALQIKTSCSKPLSLGDRFGSFVVYGMDREEDGEITLGGLVQYQYKVTNPNASTVDNVTVTDSELGEIVSGASIPAGGMQTFTQTATLYSTTTNIATATGDVGGSVCEAATDQVTVDVDIPPYGSFECSEPISELTMTWDGTQTVDVKAWEGDPGTSTLLATFDDVAPGDVITVSGLGADYPIWEVFDSTGVTKLGESSFDLWCNDHKMNGVEDCGRNEGDLKWDDPSLINDWLLEGMVDTDETLECSPELPADPGESCGLGPELIFVMPGLLWLHGRRRRKA